LRFRVPPAAQRIIPKVTRDKKEFSEEESKYDGWQQVKLSLTVSRQNKDEGSKLRSFKIHMFFIINII
jgi:hypothetical protein